MRASLTRHGWRPLRQCPRLLLRPVPATAATGFHTSGLARQSPAEKLASRKRYATASAGRQQPAASSETADRRAVADAVTAALVDPAVTGSIPEPSSEGGGGGLAERTVDWSNSFHGLSTTPFEPRVAELLLKPVDPLDVEIKPDGIIYLPEIKYRRILNAAFGPGGWGLAPRGDLVVGEKVVSREFALVVHGRFIAVARGECAFFSPESVPTAGEGCKSNALMRCCKDLGIASELWDPRFIRQFKKQHCRELWVEHVVNKKRRQVWTRKDSEPAYPFAIAKAMAKPT